MRTIEIIKIIIILGRLKETEILKVVFKLLKNCDVDEKVDLAVGTNNENQD